jgi:catechol 2,3-dioxygenase-like lactoylglutathione lyase family enzyme
MLPTANTRNADWTEPPDAGCEELDRSIDFYHRLLGFRLAATRDAGACLALGDLWLCLSRSDLTADGPRPDYTDYAFDISQDRFAPFLERLRAEGVKVRKENRSEGDSIDFLDPDGHKLDVHVGNLASRLAQCRARPYAGMQFSD